MPQQMNLSLLMSDPTSTKKEEASPTVSPFSIAENTPSTQDLPATSDTTTSSKAYKVQQQFSAQTSQESSTRSFKLSDLNIAVSDTPVQSATPEQSTIPNKSTKDTTTSQTEGSTIPSSQAPSEPAPSEFIESATSTPLKVPVTSDVQEDKLSEIVTETPTSSPSPTSVEGTTSV